MRKIISKINKLTLPATILITSLILGSFYYAAQINKQKSIEKQQQLEIEAEKQESEAKAKQEHKEYIAKRKMECYEIYEKEMDKWNNVENYGYIEICPDPSGGSLSSFLCQDDSCEIIYKDNETGEYFRKYY